MGRALETMLNVNKTIEVLKLSDCNITDPVAKHIITGLTKNTSLVTLDIGPCTLSFRCVMSFLLQVTTHPTLKSLGEVNFLGFGIVEMDRRTLWCVMGHTIPENCMEFFRALNNSGLKGLKLNIEGLTDQTAEHFAVGLVQ